MKIYYDSSTETAPVLIDGAPPVDQTALVAQLTSQRDAALATVAALNVKIAAAQAALA